jgi:flagellar biosynthesis/type III secretory pathway chaperone
MQALIQALIEVMAQTERVFLELQPVVEKERAMVCSAKVDLLTANSLEKERLAALLKRLDQQRCKLLDRIALVTGIPVDRLTISLLAANAEPWQGHELKRLGQSLKTILNAIRRNNNENRALIHHCLGMVRKTITFLSPQRSQAALYGASGSMADSGPGGRLVSGNI